MIVFVECFTDEHLAKLVGVAKRNLRHAGDKGRVLARLKNGGEPRATGLVDDDPGKPQPGEILSYDFEPETDGLRFGRHRNIPGRSLVVVTPRIEEWFVARARALGLDPPHRSPRELHEIDPNRDARYRRFLETLSGRDPAFARLRGWLAPEG